MRDTPGKLDRYKEIVSSIEKSSNWRGGLKEKGSRPVTRKGKREIQHTTIVKVSQLTGNTKRMYDGFQNIYQGNNLEGV